LIGDSSWVFIISANQTFFTFNYLLMNNSSVISWKKSCLIEVQNHLWYCYYHKPLNNKYFTIKKSHQCIHRRKNLLHLWCFFNLLRLKCRKTFILRSEIFVPHLHYPKYGLELRRLSHSQDIHPQRVQLNETYTNTSAWISTSFCINWNYSLSELAIELVACFLNLYFKAQLLYYH